MLIVLQNIMDENICIKKCNASRDINVNFASTYETAVTVNYKQRFKKWLQLIKNHDPKNTCSYVTRLLCT